MNYDWETLGEGVWRVRLPFLDVTVGLVRGETGALLVDSGTTLIEARNIDHDVAALTGQTVRQIILTHNHFDHVLGSGGFRGAEIYCAPEVALTITQGKVYLRADAIRHGADPVDVDEAVAALPAPAYEVRDATIDLGVRSVTICHPGRGHTDHDLIVLVPGVRTVVFCGDLVEESGDPVVDSDSDLAQWPDTLQRMLAAGGADPILVPGHGAVVDTGFVRRQQQWLRAHEKPQ